MKRFINHMEFHIFLWLIFNGCEKDRKGSRSLPNLITAQLLGGLNREFVTPAIGAAVVEASASCRGWRVGCTADIQSKGIYKHPVQLSSPATLVSRAEKLHKTLCSATKLLIQLVHGLALMVGALQLIWALWSHIPWSTLKEQEI